MVVELSAMLVNFLEESKLYLENEKCLSEATGIFKLGILKTMIYYVLKPNSLKVLI